MQEESFPEESFVVRLNGLRHLPKREGKMPHDGGTPALREYPSRRAPGSGRYKGMRAEELFPVLAVAEGFGATGTGS